MKELQYALDLKDMNSVSVDVLWRVFRIYMHSLLLAATV